MSFESMSIIFSLNNEKYSLFNSLKSPLFIAVVNNISLKYTNPVFTATFQSDMLQSWSFVILFSSILLLFFKYSYFVDLLFFQVMIVAVESVCFFLFRCRFKSYTLLSARVSQRTINHLLCISWFYCVRN